MVLLLHELPDGSSHFDWMIQRARGDGGRERRPRAGKRCLLSFRVSDRIDEPGVGAFRGERIADHRFAYLDYEGPVGGRVGGLRAKLRRARGRVTRLAAGVVVKVKETKGAVIIRARFEGGEEHVWAGWLEGDAGSGRWRFLRGDVSLAGPVAEWPSGKMVARGPIGGP